MGTAEQTVGDEGPVRLVVDGPVARLTLAAPERGNPLDLAMATGFQRAVEQIASLPEVAVVRLDAQGKAFCVGGDLREFAGVADPAAHVALVAAAAHAGLSRLRELPVTVVSVIQGAAAGGGLGIALAGDIVVAARSVRLRSAYTAAGLSPDCGVIAQLSAALGRARTLDLVLTNRTVMAEEAAQWGLVSRVVEDEQLDDAASEIVTALASGARQALTASRRLVHAAPLRTYAEQLDAEAASIAALCATPDGREGIAAFLSKRSPRFGSS